MNTKELIDKIFKDPKTKYELSEFLGLGKEIHEMIELFSRWKFLSHRPLDSGKD